MATFPARLGEPSTTYALSLEGGHQVAMATDATGRVTPASADEAAVAEHHGLGTAPTTTKAAKAKHDDTAPAAPAEEA